MMTTLPSGVREYVISATRLPASATTSAPSWFSSLRWTSASGDLRGAGDLTHLAALEVLERRDELGPRVHHEGTIARDGLLERNAAEEQQPTAAAGEPHRVAFAQHRKLSVADGGVADAQFALEDVRQHPQLGCEGHGDVGAGLDRPVLEDDWCAGVDDRLHAERLASDQSHGCVRRLRDRQLRARHFLIARANHLVAPG